MIKHNRSSALPILENQLDRLLGEISSLLVDAYDTVALNDDVLECKKRQAAELGMKIALRQITHTEY